MLCKNNCSSSFNRIYNQLNNINVQNGINTINAAVEVKDTLKMP